MLHAQHANAMAAMKGLRNGDTLGVRRVYA
jgi:hypothetical protein